MKNTGFSLDELNLVAASENSFEFEYIRGDGRQTGVFLSVIGGQAPKVQEFVRKYFNQKRTQEAVAAKRGKEITRLIEDDEEFGINYAAIRLVGWKGITEPFSAESAKILCSNNREIRDQIVEVSDNLANFTKN